jgi:diphthamide biosynthesis protein 7
MDLAALSRGAIGPPPDGTEILFLSFCWHPSRPDLAAVTTSTGHVYIVYIPILDEGNSWELRPEPVITHMLETWCAAISPAATIPSDSKQQSEDGGRQGGAEVVEKEAVFRVYSGGDDSMLCFTTCRWGREGLLTDTISPRESRGHDAGVTAILPLFIEEKDGIQHELVVTGSYDERIRLFAIPLRIGGGKAKNLAESSLGGGVWRLKLIDLDRRAQPDYSWRARILASCMHGGVRIVELTGTAASEYHFRVLCRFEEHKSMNYGSDYQPGWRDKLSVVSTSFYDKLLCLWEFASP